MPTEVKTLFDFCPSNTSLEQAVLRLIRDKQVFTADDLHVLETEIARHKRDVRVIGALLASLAKQGYIEKVGYVKSSRKTCHNRPVLQWRNLGTVNVSPHLFERTVKNGNKILL